MSGRLDLPEILLTGPGEPIRVPPWMKGYQVEAATAKQVELRSSLPAVTVVRAAGPGAMLARRSFLKVLAARHQQGGSGKIVFVFSEPARGDARQATRTVKVLLGHFTRIADVELAQGTRGAALAVQEAMAKLMLEPPAQGTSKGDPLGNVKRLLEATAGLRSASGRVDAEKVAESFGMSVAELAKLVGKSRQAVSKTPDAESLQERLRPYVRTCRLLAVLSRDDFRAWLNGPNAQLDGRAPLDLIRARKAAVVANLVDDMLTGTPS